MFELGWDRLVVLVVAALFVLGPERLPAAAAWLGRSVRTVKGILADADQHLRAEWGAELDQLRQPLQDLAVPLRELRSLRDPGTVLIRELLADPAARPLSTSPPVPAPARPVPPIDPDAT